MGAKGGPLTEITARTRSGWWAATHSDSAAPIEAPPHTGASIARPSSHRSRSPAFFAYVRSSGRSNFWLSPWPRVSGKRACTRSKNLESSTEAPWIHTTGGRTGSPASRQCRRTPVGSDTSGSARPPLETARHPRHRVRADPVHHGDEEVELEGPDLAIVDDLGGFGQVHVADDRGERGVLEEDDHLRHQRRDHVAQRLGQDDVAHRLRAGESQRPRRLHLPARHRLHAGAHDLAEVE